MSPLTSRTAAPELMTDTDPSSLNVAGQTAEPRSERRRARVRAVLVTTTSAGTYWTQPARSHTRVLASPPLRGVALR